MGLLYLYCVYDTTHIPDLIFNVDGCERLLAKKIDSGDMASLFVHSCRS